MSFFGGKTKKSTKKKTSDEEFTFTLSNIDIAKIDKNFNMDKMKDFGCDKNIIFEETTSLEKLGISSLKREPITTIIAKDKRKIYTYLTLIDIISNKQIPIETNSTKVTK